MKKIAIACVLGILGCQHVNKVTSPEPELVAHVDGARSEVVSAKATNKAKDYVGTDKHLDAAVVHLDAEKKVIATVSADAVETEKKLNDADAYIQKHRNDWLGARAHRDLLWLTVIGGVLALGMGALRVFAPTSSIFVAVYHVLMAVVTGGLSLIHGLGVKIMSLITRKKVEVTSTPKGAA